MGHLGLHIVPKDLVQVVQKIRLAGCSKEFQRALIDTQYLVAGNALVHPGRILCQVFSEVSNTFGAPSIEQLLEGTEILQPERCRRQIEHVLKIGA